MINVTNTINRYARILHFSQSSGFRFFNRLWLAYMPDSVCRKKSHAEVFKLYEKFRKHNRGNNGGDIGRLLSWILNIKHTIDHNKIEGDFAELGVYKGNSAAILAHYATEYARRCYLFDTFQGFSETDLQGIDQSSRIEMFSNTSLDLVQDVIGHPEINACEIIPGHFPDSIPDQLSHTKFAVVSLDCDLYKPTVEALQWFFPRMDHGALIMLHDYSSGLWPGTTKAIDEFCKTHNQHLVLLPDKSGSAFIRVHKTGR